eukprot:5783728-Amphidinium_carterae.1
MSAGDNPHKHHWASDMRTFRTLSACDHYDLEADAIEEQLDEPKWECTECRFVAATAAGHRMPKSHQKVLKFNSMGSLFSAITR